MDVASGRAGVKMAKTVKKSSKHPDEKEDKALIKKMIKDSGCSSKCKKPAKSKKRG
jgi:hypothetical protein